MKFIYPTVFTLLLSSISIQVNAERIAITNATIHTATEQGILKNASLVIENGVISAINPLTIDADTIIDAKGQVLTPGFIGTMNQLGLIEVAAVSSSRDAGHSNADIRFDPSLAFNANSSVIPYGRKGGITSNLVTPEVWSDDDGAGALADPFKGQAFMVNLSGDMTQSLQETKAASIAIIGATSGGSRASSLQQIEDTFEQAQQRLAQKTDSKTNEKENNPDLAKQEINKLTEQLVMGKQPLLVYANRASDIQALINLKQRYQLQLVIVGAGDGVLLAKELAQAQIPVLIDPIANLPGSFDTLNHSLERSAQLTSAGVKVGFYTNVDSHNVDLLRFAAGNAVANGMSKTQALQGVSANIADMLNLNSGKIAQGKAADLVLWSGDPFEFSTQAEQVWIGGEKMSLTSRQDALRDRYLRQSNMPKAYVK